jgi:hypothetical protein
VLADTVKPNYLNPLRRQQGGRSKDLVGVEPDYCCDVVHDMNLKTWETLLTPREATVMMTVVEEPRSGSDFRERPEA